MSSINGGANSPSPLANSGGINMAGTGGQMPEGGGSFYMGDDGSGGQQQQQQGNPELLYVDQAEVDRRSQNRQYLEGLITGKDSFWANPWDLNPSDNLKFRGRRDLTRGSTSNPKVRRQLLVNA